MGCDVISENFLPAASAAGTSGGLITRCKESLFSTPAWRKQNNISDDVQVLHNDHLTCSRRVFLTCGLQSLLIPQSSPAKDDPQSFGRGIHQRNYVIRLQRCDRYRSRDLQIVCGRFHRFYLELYARASRRGGRRSCDVRHCQDAQIYMRGYTPLGFFSRRFPFTLCGPSRSQRESFSLAWIK